MAAAPTLAYLALISSDPTAARRVLGEGLGLTEGQLDDGTPLFRAGTVGLALSRPGDRFVDGATRTGLHHLGLASGGGAAELCGIPIRFVAPPALPSPSDGPVERIDHIGVASADNRVAIRAFVDGLGCPLESTQTDLEVSIAVESFTSDKYGVVSHARQPVPQGGLKVAFVTVGECELEFLQNFDPRQSGEVRHGAAGDTRQDQGAIARYVAARGPGLHHLALKVRDIDATLARLAELDVALIDHVGRPGSRRARIGFLHPKALGGILLHLVERTPIEG